MLGKCSQQGRKIISIRSYKPHYEDYNIWRKISQSWEETLSHVSAPGPENTTVLGETWGSEAQTTLHGEPCLYLIGIFFTCLLLIGKWMLPSLVHPSERKWTSDPFSYPPHCSLPSFLIMQRGTQIETGVYKNGSYRYFLFLSVTW
jgi:hypothetical protein